MPLCYGIEVREDRGMKKFSVLALGALALAGCDVVTFHGGGPQVVGSGKVTTVSRHVGSFKKIKLEGAMDADLTIGTASDVKIVGDDNLAPLVQTEIEGDTLRIFVGKNYGTHNGLKVTLSVPTLEGVSLAGSGDVSIHAFKGGSLNIAVSGSGDVTAEGTAGKVTASVKGSGDLKLYGLQATDADISIKGSGDAQVTATGHLTGSIAGSGDIRYKGPPNHVSRSVAGSGDVTPGE
jgi:hypothetical protein